jgi:hypothetical protein
VCRCVVESCTEYHTRSGSTVNRIARAVARLVNYQPARGSRIINFTRRHEIIYNDVATFYTVVYRST